MTNLACRLRDLVVAVTLLLIMSPLLLLIALLLFATQERVLFVQTRPGYLGTPFRLVKFSTMRDIRPGEREEDGQQARLTTVGKLLRRYSLDELPQLWNVLRGEMSLVGPRPLLMGYLPLYTPEQARRHEVTPGITGWAQVHGRNALSFTERFRYDVWYVDNRSFGLDLRILWKTIFIAVSGKGVYANEQTTSPLFDGTN